MTLEGVTWELCDCQHIVQLFLCLRVSFSCTQRLRAVLILLMSSFPDLHTFSEDRRRLCGACFEPEKVRPVFLLSQLGDSACAGCFEAMSLGLLSERADPLLIVLVHTRHDVVLATVLEIFSTQLQAPL